MSLTVNLYAKNSNVDLEKFEPLEIHKHDKESIRGSIFNAIEVIRIVNRNRSNLDMLYGDFTYSSRYTQYESP